MSAMRLYSADELGRDGYPPEWHLLPMEHPLLDEADLVLPGGIKDVVRAFAGHRCVRCRHPYGHGRPVGPRGEWTPCDEHCTHRGPARYRPGWSELGEAASGYADVDPWAAETATPPEATAGDLIVGGIDIEAQWRILTVHHLDGNKANCRWWNLVALCQRCHLQIQGRVQMERVWPWEHSEWFRPYVAGYYALVYLGEEIEREEAEARMDELLALEAVT